VAAFLDIEGAFNNVTPTPITGALTELGIERPIVGLIHTMLTSRVVYSTVGLAHSTRNVSRGTPQGGLLSPLLWVIVVNKLLSLLEDAGTKVVAYAGDVVIVLQGKFPQTLCNLMGTALSTLSRWTAVCGLGVNPEKTELVLFTRKYKIPNLILSKLHQTRLTLSNQAKYLGVILDKNIRNQNIHRDPGILAVKDEIDKQKASYTEKLSVHPNRLARGLTWVSSRSRLQRNDLPTQQKLLGALTSIPVICLMVRLIV